MNSSESQESYERFVERFPSHDACLEYLRERFAPDGSECAACGRATKFHRIKSRAAYSCQWCGHQVYPTAGTIFHKSTTSLQLWFWAIFLMSATRCGITAKQLEREIGVSYPTARRMFKQIEALLNEDDAEAPAGEVETGATEAAAQIKPWRRQVVTASACALLGLMVGIGGGALPAPVALVCLVVGIIGASLLLSWAADAAEAADISGALMLAGLTLLTVLPELAVEVQLAYSQQTELISANLTGATRLLLTGAVATPLLGAWLLARRGEQAGRLILPPARRVELAILFVAAMYGVVIAVLGRVTLFDALLFGALYVFYLRRIRGTPDEPPAVVGVSAGLAALPRRVRRPLLGAMTALAAGTVVLMAEPFTTAILATGTSIGIDEYLLVQSIAPVATETPEYVVAAVLAINHRPAQALAVFLAASVAQWTLAIGVIPFAYAAGGGGLMLPLDTRESVEVALTVATTLMAVAALASLAPKRSDSWIMLALFVVQFAFPSTAVRIAVAVVFLMFAVDIFVENRKGVRPIFAALRSHPPPA